MALKQSLWLIQINSILEHQISTVLATAYKTASKRPKHWGNYLESLVKQGENKTKENHQSEEERLNMFAVNNAVHAYWLLQTLQLLSACPKSSHLSRKAFSALYDFSPLFLWAVYSPAALLTCLLFLWFSPSFPCNWEERCEGVHVVGQWQFSQAKHQKVFSDSEFILQLFETNQQQRLSLVEENHWYSALAEGKTGRKCR